MIERGVFYMRKIITLLLAIVLVIGLCGCIRSGNIPEQESSSLSQFDKVFSDKPFTIKDKSVRWDKSSNVHSYLIVAQNEDITIAFETTFFIGVDAVVGQEFNGTLYYRKVGGATRMFYRIETGHDLYVFAWRTANYKDELPVEAEKIKTFTNNNPLQISIRSWKGYIYSNIIELRNEEIVIGMIPDIDYYANHHVSDIVTGTLYKHDDKCYFDTGDGHVMEVRYYINIKDNTYWSRNWNLY